MPVPDGMLRFKDVWLKARRECLLARAQPFAKGNAGCITRRWSPPSRPVLVTLGVFLLIHLVPGDPVEAMLGESQDAVAKERCASELGFDQPLYIQYVTWLGRIVQGDLGRSVRSHQTVLDDVGRRIRPSLELAVFAMSSRCCVAVPLGILTATHRNSAARQPRHRLRPVRHLHAEFRHCAVARSLSSASPPLAADLQLHRSLRRSAGRYSVADTASDHPGPGPGSGHRAHTALEPARDTVGRLRAHGARKGP